MNTFLNIFVASFIALFCFSTQAKEQVGIYEVPVEDANLKEHSLYESVVKYKGKSILEADELEVTMPLELTGLENKFTLKKKNNADGSYEWVSDSQLFSYLKCEAYTELVCEMHFKPELVEVVDVSQLDMLGAFIKLNVAHFRNTETFRINKSLAREQMLMKDFPQEIIDAKLEISDLFSSEPIGFLRYSIEQ